jgi:hypothetical protein
MKKKVDDFVLGKMPLLGKAEGVDPEQGQVVRGANVILEL